MKDKDFNQYLGACAGIIATISSSYFIEVKDMFLLISWIVITVGLIIYQNKFAKGENHDG